MVVIKRHLTALNRKEFSRPVQHSLKRGIINPRTTVLDYGCGKGADVRILTQNKYIATGYDPYYFKKKPKRNCKFNIVMLTYVNNTIEDEKERIDVIKDAISYATDWFIISSRYKSPGYPKNTWKVYNDGYITSRQTFQKFYTESEILKECEAAFSCKNPSLKLAKNILAFNLN